jgi:hypothetical protein
MRDGDQVLVNADFGENRFSSNATLPLDYARCRAVRQIHINAATKTD